MTFELKKCAAASMLLATLLATASAAANSRYPLAGQVVVSPGNTSTIVARSTFGMLESTDAGKSWTWICESAIGYFGSEDPPIAVTGDGSTLVASTIGIGVSHDGGCSWVNNPGLGTGRFAIDVTVQPAHPDQAFAIVSGRVDGAYTLWLARSDDNGRTFNETGPALPADFVATTVEVAPTNPQRVYVSGKIFSTQQGAIERSDDGGVSWAPYLLDIHGSASIYIGAVDPVDADIVYVRTLDDTTSRVIATRDGGVTWKDVWSAPGDVPGLALSADGGTLAVGGPMAGINIASTSDWAFRQTSKVGAYCLSWLGNDLVACGKEAIEGFSIGVSHDEGAHFSPVLHLADIVPRSCPAGSQGTACATEWAPVAKQIGVDAGGSTPGSGPAGRNPELNPVGDESPNQGCGCRTAANQRPSAAFALPAAMLLMLVGRRRSTKRGRSDAVGPAA
jgi:MYXO-CTERM domain-containing protein